MLASLASLTNSLSCFIPVLIEGVLICSWIAFDVGERTPSSDLFKHCRRFFKRSGLLAFILANWETFWKWRFNFELGATYLTLVRELGDGIWLGTEERTWNNVAILFLSNFTMSWRVYSSVPLQESLRWSLNWFGSHIKNSSELFFKRVCKKLRGLLCKR